MNFTTKSRYAVNALADLEYLSHHETPVSLKDIAHRQDIDLTLKINDILVEFFMEANLILVDYKLEFGKFQGKMLLADEFTPDGCRLWDKDTLTKMDKDRFRQDLGNVIETYGEVGERLGMKIKLD